MDGQLFLYMLDDEPKRMNKHSKQKKNYNCANILKDVFAMYWIEGSSNRSTKLY